MDKAHLSLHIAYLLRVKYSTGKPRPEGSFMLFPHIFFAESCGKDP